MKRMNIQLRSGTLVLSVVAVLCVTYLLSSFIVCHQSQKLRTKTWFVFPARKALSHPLAQSCWDRVVPHKGNTSFAPFVYSGNQTFGGPHCSKMKHDKIVALTQLLLDLHQILLLNKICYWATDGTLLGLYRHGTLLPWDHDSDIGYHASQHALIVKVRRTLFSSDYTSLQVLAINPWEFANTQVFVFVFVLQILQGTFLLRVKDGDFYIRVSRHVSHIDTTVWVDLYGFETIPGTDLLKPHPPNFTQIEASAIFPLQLAPVSSLVPFFFFFHLTPVPFPAALTKTLFVVGVVCCWGSWVGVK